MMGEEFYCILKIITGEEIFSLISIDENDGDPLIILQNPVVMRVLENPMGTYVKINPWMQIPSDDFYIIKSDKIITMTEIKDKKLINLYTKYLNDVDSDEYDESLKIDGKVKLSQKMGYIGSVDDARRALEDLYKDSKES